MIKPTADFMIVELYEEFERIVRPETTLAGTGDSFIVKDIGPGFTNENGTVSKSEIQIGDRVWCCGKMLRLPYGRTEVLIARAGDVIAYERENKPDP